MKSNQPYSEIKSSARNALTGHYFNAILVLINTGILSLLPKNLVMVLFPSTGFVSIVLSEIIGFILTVFLQLFQIGTCFFYLKLNCGQQASVIDIFYGFTNNANKTLKINLLLTSISYVCMLPFTILNYCNVISPGSASIKILYLLLLGGNIINQLIAIPFSQCYYLLLDFPNRSPKEIIQYCLTIMKRNYGRYLLFILSFVPLLLLSFLSFGVGLLWVLPYMESSFSSFYLDLIKNYKSES